MKKCVLVVFCALFLNATPSDACGPCKVPPRIILYRISLVSTFVVVASAAVIEGVWTFATYQNLSVEIVDPAKQGTVQAVTQLSLASAVVVGMAMLPSGMLLVAKWKDPTITGCTRFTELLVVGDLVTHAGLMAGTGVQIQNLQPAPQSHTFSTFTYPLWVVGVAVSSSGLLFAIMVPVMSHILKKHQVVPVST
jgi:hypothetical protein